MKAKHVLASIATLLYAGVIAAILVPRKKAKTDICDSRIDEVEKQAKEDLKTMDDIIADIDELIHIVHNKDKMSDNLQILKQNVEAIGAMDTFYDKVNDGIEKYADGYDILEKDETSAVLRDRDTGAVFGIKIADENA